MAARKTRWQSEHTRQKIRAAYLIRRLQLHAAGKINLTLSQVRAIDILLKKIVPDLTQASITGELMHKYVVEVPPLLSKDEWQKKYALPKPAPRQLPVIIEQQPLLELEPAKPNGHDGGGGE
jgi:hypothetical protein